MPILRLETLSFFLKILMRKLLPALCLLLLPAALPAQTQTQTFSPSSRVSLTAFTGARVPFTTGQVAFYSPDGELLVRAEQQRGGTPVLGLEGEYRVFGRLSLVGAGIYSRAGRVDFIDPDSSVTAAPLGALLYDGDTAFGRAGLSLRFEAEHSETDARPRPFTDIMAGAAVVHDMSRSHPALSVGFKGSLPVARSLEFALGVEDYFVFWDKRHIERWMQERVGGGDESGRVRLFYNTSNILMLRAGFTLRP